MGLLDKRNVNGDVGAEGGDPAARSPWAAPSDPWSARLDKIDRYLEDTKTPGPEADGPAALPDGTKRRTRWWWVRRGLLAFLALFVLTVLWLAITAPLSKSLQPIAPPQIGRAHV